MTGAKFGAIATTALVLVYLFLVGERGLALLLDPSGFAKAIGGLILVIPAVAIWGIIRELSFGLRIEKLAKQLQSEGKWPEFGFEVRPSGRAVKSSVQENFEPYREQAEKYPDDWRSWFTLGLVYDAAGDRPRARAAMRRAIAVARK